MHRYIVGAPLERIDIDIGGHFPQSESGNRQLFIVMDNITRCPKENAIPN
jgi:hypothetical protein